MSAALPQAVLDRVLERRARRLDPADLPWIEALLRDSHTWAYVDALAVHVVGVLLDRHPASADVLDRWIADPDPWIRRAALVAPLLPLRQGRGDPTRFFDHAARCLHERDVFVRKAIGWVLRDMGRSRPREVEAFVAAHARQMSGLTFREAVRKLDPAVRDRLTAGRG